MTITETNNTDFARTVVLWKVADTLRSATPRSQKRSEGGQKNETPESRWS